MTDQPTNQLWRRWICLSAGQRGNADCSVQQRMDVFDLPCRERLQVTRHLFFSSAPPADFFFFFSLSLTPSPGRPCVLFHLRVSLNVCECERATVSYTQTTLTYRRVCLFSGGGLHFERWCPELCVSVCVCVCVFHINIKLSQGHALAVSTV